MGDRCLAETIAEVICHHQLRMFDQSTSGRGEESSGKFAVIKLDSPVPDLPSLREQNFIGNSHFALRTRGGEISL
jgi:hypothetical protein